MRYFPILILALWAVSIHAQEWEDEVLFEGANGSLTLNIISSTDTSYFAPIIESFLQSYPAINVDYKVMGSADVYETFRQSPSQFDVVVSSAMDLQLKLVNDGFAQQIDDVKHPEWAHWRHSLFGFTLEPASIVINKEAFKDLPVPRTRQKLIEVLRANPDTFRGKVGTYDVRQSGLGYLFATQDARASETYWRLMEIFGSLRSRLYCCSADMIDDLADGTIAVSYNVLGSYATARNDVANRIEVILPSDFPNTMMRTALISRESHRANVANLFLRHLISSRWSENQPGNFPLPFLNADRDNPAQSIIALEPGLMVFLDRLKRNTFINEWENAIIQ